MVTVLNNLTFLNKLEALKKETDLKKEYKWKQPLPDDFPKNLRKEFEKQTTLYEKNIFLKENLSNLLEKDTDLELHYWIVRKWGGIIRFQQNEKNNKKIITFKKELLENKLSRNSFSTISSLSKIASFLNPKKYVIYDSRVTYSLNYLLLISGENKFFPFVKGRNSTLNEYEYSKKLKNNKSYTFYKRESAYHIYCNLILELSKIFNDKPYNLEMLLFTIAPTKIIDMIKKERL